MIGGDFARLALEVGAEIDDLVAGLPGQFDRGLERGLRPRDQLEPRAREGGIAGLAAFVGGIVERAADGVVDFEVIFRDDRAGIRKRGRDPAPSAPRRSRKVVVRHVGDRQRHDFGQLRRRAPAGRP